MRYLLACLLLLAPLSALALPAAGARGMVAAAHPDAGAAGVTILRAGGNAVDAAVATAFALAVVEPQSSGIGGGGFAMVRFEGKLRFVDFREVAPAKASRDMFMKGGAPQPELARDGVLSAGVPGAVAGYLDLLDKHGKLPRAKVLEPAIRLAADGFVVDAAYRADALWRLEALRKDPEAASLFLTAGEAPPIGHVIVQRELAETLRAIAKEGAAAFYTGSVARKLAADMQARGGLVTADDLARYKVRDRAPLIGSYRGHAVATSPPPSAGGQVVLTLLNVLETMPPKRPWRDVEGLHLYIEACKRAFADRQLIGDPFFVRDLTAPLITKDRARLLAAAIEPRAAKAADVPPGQGAQLPADAKPISPSKKDPRARTHTTHLVAVDAAGNAVSLTSTVNYGFGSGVVARGTGVLWNDQMDDFAIAPGVPNTYGVVGSEANAVEAGKVPLSSMSPTLVFEGPTVDSPVRLVVGSPGGPRIPTTVVQTILHVLDHGLDVQQALSIGRVHHQHLPDVVMLEPAALDAATVAALQARGHTFEVQESWSNATAIAIDPKTGLRTGAADPRGVGTALAE